MSQRFIGSTVHLGNYDKGLEPRVFEAGTPESEVPEDYRATVGEHIWTDKDPRTPEFTATADHARIGELQSALADRDATVSELRKQVETLQRQLDEVQQTTGGGSNPEGESEVPAEQTGAEPQPEDEDLPEWKLKQMKKDELLSLAAERGVEVAEGATNAEIIASLQA